MFGSQQYYNALFLFTHQQVAYELYFIVSFLWFRNSVRFEHLWHLMLRVPQVSVHCKVSKWHLHVTHRQLNTTTFFRPCVKLINSIQTVWRCYVRYPMANMWELVHQRLQGNLIRPYEQYFIQLILPITKSVGKLFLHKDILIDSFPNSH